MAETDTEQLRGEIIAKAWEDAAFKQRLLSNPRDALKEMGVEVPDGVNLTVLESTLDENYFVLPPEPTEELSEEALDTVSGGMSPPCPCTTSSSLLDAIGRRIPDRNLRYKFLNFSSFGFLRRR